MRDDKHQEGAIVSGRRKEEWMMWGGGMAQEWAIAERG